MITVVAEDTGWVVTGKVTLGAPAGTTMEAGATAAAVLSLARWMARPLEGAGPLKVIVPVAGLPPPTEAGLICSDVTEGSTVSVADAVR